MAATLYERIFCQHPTADKREGLAGLKFQVQHALKATGQLEFITGDAHQEAEGYEDKKQKALHLILQCVWQSFMPMVMGSQTPSVADSTTQIC